MHLRTIRQISSRRWISLNANKRPPSTFNPRFKSPFFRPPVDLKQRRSIMNGKDRQQELSQTLGQELSQTLGIEQRLAQNLTPSHSLTLSHSHSHTDTHDHPHGIGSLLGHSHSHGHVHTNDLLKETTNNMATSTATGSFLSNPAARITWIGLAVNLVLAISKGVGGIYFKSQALVADALHSLSDLVSDFLTLATVNMLAKVGTPDHFPMGYGKIETVGSILICMTLLFAGISVGWSSLLNLLEFVIPPNVYDILSSVQLGHSHTHLPGMEDPHHSHSHSHTGGTQNHVTTTTMQQVPNINAAWLAGGSIIVKEILYHKTMKVALATNSKVLVANAWHHRVDSLTAAIALISVAGGVMFNVAWLDSVGGLAVSFLIVKAGTDAFKSSWNEIIDKGEPKNSETYYKVEDILTDVKPADFDISELSVLSSGANINVFAELSTANEYTLSQLNDIEDKLVAELRTHDSFVRKIVISFKQKEL
ncbi:uncharacterized protein KQ657_002399 [Scheffersomyces spartinae]|uniref:Cation efflux protein transmembrane domain-containing protein n=1 Tax=Scheffersomyces spartinae TaxID=45513 RepID=A0A9P8AGV7_9ASCO|nr:uncharacterized protein KQ657_002399 [Scheffersomyces spartinae]KAG7192042.1 hypothetical protein KQ657_002399 [Scheffersomyces spartinae]